MKNLSLIIIYMILSGCAKEIVNSRTQYVAYSYPGNFTISYTDNNGLTKTQSISGDLWTYDFISENGDYLSLTATSSNDSTMIMGAIISNNDTVSIDTIYANQPTVSLSYSLP